MEPQNTTVVICCAGMGTRLGIGTTKALINISDKPLIIRLLEQLDNYDDIRIVVGYQSEKVIKIVNEYRKNVMYVFNKDYENNGPAASMWKALLNARENIIVLDGDIVVEPISFNNFLKFKDECIAFSYFNSDEPTYLNIIDGKVMHFSNKKTKFVFPGIVKIKKENISEGKGFIYETIEHNLPILALKVDAMEIDTQDDYERVILWIKSGYKKEEVKNEKE